MSREIQVSLHLAPIPIKELDELDFDKLRSDLEFLAQQPPVEVLPCYKDKEVDYEVGHRDIRVVSIRASPLKFEYLIIDRASVMGSVDYSNSVGRRTYTQAEVDELRS